MRDLTRDPYTPAEVEVIRRRREAAEAAHAAQHTRREDHPMTDGITPEERAELRAIAQGTPHPALPIRLPARMVLALLDALDTADEPGREVETPDGHTFALVCGGCATGRGCRAHPEEWDEQHAAQRYAERNARPTIGPEALQAHDDRRRARRDAHLEALMSTEDPTRPMNVHEALNDLADALDADAR